jgi:CHAD domain-containing protein
LTSVEEQLSARLRAAAEGLLHCDAIDPVPARLEQLIDRSKRWPRRHGWRAIGAGLCRTYRGAKAARKTSRKNPTIANLHEWRKQTKYLRYQLEALRPMWPVAIDQLCDMAKDLSDLLGQDHDLAVLRQALGEPNVCPNGVTRAALELRIDTSRTELQKRAFRRSQSLFGSGSKDFADRLAACWHVWK